MTRLLSILLLSCLPALGQIVGGAGVWGNATFIVPTNWAALYGFVTNATGYPLLAWYQADNYTTNAGVATLPDSWTNQWHLTNVTTSAFPTGVPADLGGHTTIQFDGANDYLNTVLYTNVQPSEVWLVMMENGSTGGTTCMYLGGVGVSPVAIYRNSSGSLSAKAGTGNPLYGSTYSPSNIWITANVVFAGAGSAFYTNGVLSQTGTMDGTTAGQLTLGTRDKVNDQSKFKLAELICYGNGNATPGTNTIARSNIWFYIQSKYGLR